MNLNELARRIATREGGKQQQSIAQIKETMRIILQELAAMEPAERDRVIARYPPPAEDLSMVLIPSRRERDTKRGRSR